MKHGSKILLKGVLIAIIFGGGYILGSTVAVNSSVRNDAGIVEVSKVVDLYQKTRSDKVSFDQYWDIWDMIHERYVSDDVNDVDLYYKSLEGLVAGLGDPHSIYFPPTEAKEFTENISGEFKGIGAEIGIKDDLLTVIAPLPESPAQKAGLRPLDIITAINGENTVGTTLESAVTKIRGEQGTSVLLTVLRKESQEPIEISIVRDVITVPTVLAEKRDDNLAYLRVSYFNEDTLSSFNEEVKKIIDWDVDGIILDMRSNPGGLLNMSVLVASEWIPEGEVIVEEKGRNGVERTHVSQGPHRFVGIPTMVLVDEGTASGSEIVAGALKDHGAGTLIGRKSYGKGSVQTFEVLPDGSAIKLTIAKWFTPNGTGIDKEGITPEYVVELNEETLEHDAAGQIIDPDIAKAVELFKK